MKMTVKTSPNGKITPLVLAVQSMTSLLVDSIGIRRVDLAYSQIVGALSAYYPRFYALRGLRGPVKVGISYITLCRYVSKAAQRAIIYMRL